MTTVIATRDAMAADQFFTDGSRAKKILRGKGLLVGIAGDAYYAFALGKWVVDGMRGAPPEPTEKHETRDEAALLVLRSDGLYQCNGRGVLMELECDVFAVGSGSEYAMGAFAAGAPLDDAVEIAARFDANTKGPIQLEYLKARRKSVSTSAP